MAANAESSLATHRARQAKKKAAVDTKETVAMEAKAARGLRRLDKMASALKPAAEQPRDPPSEQSQLETRFQDAKAEHDRYSQTVKKVAEEERRQHHRHQNATLTAEAQAARVSAALMAHLKTQVAAAVVTSAASSQAPDLVRRAKERGLVRERRKAEEEAAKVADDSATKIRALEAEVAKLDEATHRQAEEDQAHAEALARYAPQFSKAVLHGASLSAVRALLARLKGAKAATLSPDEIVAELDSLGDAEAQQQQEEKDAGMLWRMEDRGWKNMEEDAERRKHKLKHAADHA